MRVKAGEYEVVFEGGRLYALRHGLKWRDCIGDNLVYTLAAEIEDLREKLEEANAQIKQYEDHR